MSMMGGGMILTMILWIFIVGLIIYGIVLLLLKLNTKKKDTSAIEKPEDSSIEILRERFAKGEIDEQEFDDRRAFLRNKQ